MALSLEDLEVLEQKIDERANKISKKILTDELFNIEFFNLKKVITELSETQKRTEQIIEALASAQLKTEQRVEELAEAQKRTEQRLEELVEAQKRTEQRVEELAEAQKRTEQRLDKLEITMRELAEAQKRTEQRLEELAIRVDKLVTAVDNLRHEVGSLSSTIGYGLGDIAQIMLPPYLEKHYQIKLYGEEGEELQPDYISIDGEEEVDLIGEGEMNGEKIKVICECKTTIKESEVKKFKKKLENLAILENDQKLIKVLFGYRIHPSAKKIAEDIILAASYMR